MVMALAAIMSLGLLAGAMPVAAEGDGSVYWLNFKPESDEVLQEIAADYKEATGVDVKVVTAASGTYSQTLNSEMDKSAPPTLFVIGNQAGVKDWADYALDLTDTPIANELNTDAYNLYDEDGKLVSIGYCYECYGIIANPDLIEEAGHSMDEIKNFEGLKAVAEDIHARADELGFDAFSACDMDSSSSWRFTGHMANLEYFYEERDAGGWTECPAELTGAYMENFKNLYDLCINNSTVDPKELATGGHDAEAEFKDGKAVFFVNGSWEYPAVSESVPNATMIPYYCGVEGEEKAGLNCGTPCRTIWPVLRDCSAYFCACRDSVTEKGMRAYARPSGTDRAVVSGESGAVTYGLLLHILQTDDLRELFRIREDSVILLISTEGDTDPQGYLRVTGAVK